MVCSDQGWWRRNDPLPALASGHHVLTVDGVDGGLLINAGKWVSNMLSLVNEPVSSDYELLHVLYCSFQHGR
jgi:hypothetical protein